MNDSPSATGIKYPNRNRSQRKTVEAASRRFMPDGRCPISLHKMRQDATSTGAKTVAVSLLVILLLFIPNAAYADAGTPLMWAGAFHLLIGNAFIGIGEGLLLALLFQQNRAPCVVLMIAANYFSAWIGGVFLVPVITTSRNLSLYNAWRWLWCMVAVSYVVTLFLEWPFVAICLRKSKGWFRKSLWGSVVVQSASYLLLFGWYWAASGTSLYTDLAIVQPTAISLPKDATLYYIGENNCDIDMLDFRQSETRNIGRLKPSESKDRLHLVESRTAAGRWNLVVAATNVRPPDSSARVALADQAGDVAEPLFASMQSGGEVPRFPVADESGWQFHFGWMKGNLFGVNAKTDQTIDVSLETPFLQWFVSSPTQLPSGQVVFQLGRDQICILDPNEHKIALLARGRSPVITRTTGTE